MNLKFPLLALAGLLPSGQTLAKDHTNFIIILQYQESLTPIY